jgi:DNA-binding NtrC family response regulator
MPGAPERRSNHATYELPPDSVLFGCSSAMQTLRSKLFRVGEACVPLLLQGEPGVGKSLLSKFVHKYFGGAKGQYLGVNCAAVTAAEVPFAFSGLLEGPTADEGAARSNDSNGIATLFLDRVSELSPMAQRGLALLLAEQEKPSAGYRPGTPVRIIAATTRDLREEVKHGRFRRDLFDQLAVVTIQVPPLRHRVQDLPELCDYLRLRSCAKLGVTDRGFPPDIMARILRYHWPGNICELENFIGRFVSLGPEDCGPVEAFATDSYHDMDDFGEDSTEGRQIWKN